MFRFLAHIRLAHKFLVLGLIALLMVALPATIAVRDEFSAWEAARTEAVGIAPAGHILELVKLTQQHRGLSANVLGGNEALQGEREKRQAAIGQLLPQVRASLGAPPPARLPAAPAAARPASWSGRHRASGRPQPPARMRRGGGPAGRSAWRPTGTATRLWPPARAGSQPG